MKKVMIIALIGLVGAVFAANATGTNGENKKSKKTVWEFVKEDTLALNTPTDTISYASGMAATNGLINYLEKNLGIDPLFMEDFKQGFFDAIDRGGDPKYAAYNAGVEIAAQMERQIFPREAEVFADADDSLSFKNFYTGFLAGAMNDTTVFTVPEAMEYAKRHKDEIVKRKNEAYITENTAFLEENKTKEGVVCLPSGLQYKVITEGSGNTATVDDNVTVRYEGKMIDGTVFDSSYTRDPDTSTFKPSKVIKGWTEALLMMPEGSKWELYIPQELAYGERQAGKIKPYSTLIFTVEVVKVN